MIDLLPCPFCGKPDPYTDPASCEKFGYRTGHNWAVACSWCEVSAHGAASIRDAIAAWNTRAAPTLSAALALPEIAALVAAVQMCPPTSNPVLSAEQHLEAVNTWWRIYASVALATIEVKK